VFAVLKKEVVFCNQKVEKLGNSMGFAIGSQTLLAL
jgi:hypothetical protein